MYPQHQPLNLMILFQNINGWHCKKSNLRLDYEEIKPDIILLAHTNIHGTVQPIRLFPYTVYMHNTAQNFSGVAILIKRDINHSLINRKFDGDTLAIKVETSLGSIIVGTNYSPPSRGLIPIRDLN